MKKFLLLVVCSLLVIATFLPAVQLKAAPPPPKKAIYATTAVVTNPVMTIRATGTPLQAAYFLKHPKVYYVGNYHQPVPKLHLATHRPLLIKSAASQNGVVTENAGIVEKRVTDYPLLC